MTKTETEPLVLDVKKVAALLDCSERTVWKLRDKGELKSIPVMGRVKFPREEVDRYIDRHLNPDS